MTQDTINGFHVTTNLSKFASVPIPPPFWVISDTHFFHDNIIQYAGRPENHNDLMVNAWTVMVKEDDPIIHLGDIAMNKREKLVELAPRLTGQKYLVKGNHDGRGDRFYESLGFKIVKPFELEHRGWKVAFSHEPISGWANYPKHLNVHGHIHEKLMGSLQYINISVEHTEYRPVQVLDLLNDRIDQLEADQNPN